MFLSEQRIYEKLSLPFDYFRSNIYYIVLRKIAMKYLLFIKDESQHQGAK